jgi:two-component system NtrC family sensor kinase
MTDLRQTAAELEAKLRSTARERDAALEQQAATAGILKAIASSRGNAQPVFDQILQSIEHLFGGEDRAIFLTSEDGLLHIGAAFGPNADRARAIYPIPLKGSASELAMRERRLVRSADVLNDADVPPSLHDFAKRFGKNYSMVIAPMLSEERAIGSIFVARTSMIAFSDRECSLLRNFADQAVIAIENARLFDEVQAKTRDLSEALLQQTATADVLKVISRSAFDLQTVLETLIKSAVKLSDANRGAIFLREGDVFPLKAASSTTAEFLQYWAANPPKAGRGSATSRVIASGKVEIIPDVLEDPEMEMPTSSLIRIRATLGVPMLRDNKVEGVLVLTRPEPGTFTKSQIDLVQTFADQAVIAVENVRLFEETKARTKELAASLEELRAAQDRLVQTEKLASLGQLTAGIAHEIKNPLNFVNNFSALSAELIGEMNDVLAKATLDTTTRSELDELTQILKSNLEKVVQHGKRADSIVKNMLQHSREGSGEHRPADINAIVDESMNLAYHGARAEKSGLSIALQRDLDPSVGMADVYPQEITRVLLNLISNGFYATTMRKAEAGDGFEPMLSAATRNLGDRIEIRIRDNGTGIPEEVKEKIFNPFFTTKPSGEGTGLGLSMSHDIIVKQHGGSIDVETEAGLFTEFKIVLPRTSQR